MRNDDSRETAEPKLPAAPSFGRRHTISPADTSTTSPVNPSRSGPIVDSANAWTDDTTPDRVRNVPKIDNANVAGSSVTFHVFITPRFSWTVAECRKIVAVSHGRRLAFSTGSHAQ